MQGLSQAWNPEDELSVDLEEVEKKLLSGVRSDLHLPHVLSERLVRAGGKRIRPLLLCLTYRCLKQNHRHLVDRATHSDLSTLAAVAEWTHTATLFHDDVIDASPSRRELPAAHMLHGNKVAILVGDFVYAEAFSLLMERGLLDPSRELARTIKALVEGELLQHAMTQNRSLSLEDYDRVAKAKTAALFAWCTWTGAWVAGSTDLNEAWSFGSCLGFAFQMADDLFDTYSLDPQHALHEELAEWAESSPPFPVVVAAQYFPEIPALWTKLRADKTEIAQLQAWCRDERVLQACEGRIAETLQHARQILKNLGDSQQLRAAIEIIAKRAEQGFGEARDKVRL